MKIRKKICKTSKKSAKIPKKSENHKKAKKNENHENSKKNFKNPKNPYTLFGSEEPLDLVSGWSIAICDDMHISRAQTTRMV